MSITAELFSVLQLRFLLGTTFWFFFSPGFIICTVCFSIFLLFMVLTLIQICSQAVYLFPQYLVQSLSHVPTLCDPKGYSMPGFPVHHQLPELAQTHVHWVNDVTPHPLLSPSSPAFSLSQHQRIFQWVSSLHQVAKVLGFQLQRQSFQWIFRTDFL